MKKFLFIIPIALFSILYFFSSFQNKPGIAELSEKIISMMEVYVDEIPEEKVFLHLDRNYYASGDNIWFSVYLTAGSPDIPSPLSKVVYVDLLDSEGNLVQQKTVRIEEGHGYGDIRLDAFTKEGNYVIKAYSYWQKGFGDEALFRSDIQILDTYNLKFQPSVQFEKTENNDRITYTASIVGLDKRLQALPSQEVYYKISNTNSTAEEGSFFLDEEGKYELSIFMDPKDLNTPTALILSFKENEEYSISRQFLLPFPNSSIDLQFLPEGGDLIAGFNNKVAVRAIYPDGSPATLSGKINQEGQEITFETNDSGLASFSINPTSTEDIPVTVTVGETSFETNITNVKNEGINLAVDSSNEKLVNILIQSKGYENISPSGEALLVVHARGRIGHMQVINLSNGVGGARINKSQLVPGVNQLTIFEPEGTPLAERMVFVPFENELKLKLNASTKSTKAREKNTWEVNIEGDGFEGGAYSVAIVDANEMPFTTSSSINSYLKLESELRGKIHDAKSLLGQDRNDEGIELIMLTHGWKRFNWKDLLAGNFENKNFIEQGINITGTVKPKGDRKRGVTGGNMTVYSKGQSEDFISLEFGENGKFIIDDMDFSDTTFLTISAKDRRHKEFVDLELDPPLSKYSTWENFEPKLQNFNISEALRSYLNTAEKRTSANRAFGDINDIKLDEFIIQSERFDSSEEDITRIFGKGDASLKPEDIGGFDGFIDIFQLLQGRFAGVRVVSDLQGSATITIRGVGSITGGGNPMILLDNTPVDISFASTIPPSDLAAIEIFKSAASLAIFGSAAGNGAIALYTKRGAGIGNIGDGVFNLRFPGYSTVSEFYMPKYDRENPTAPDFRSTLYWNPKLEWTGNSAKVEFFNNDIVEKYKIIIQGMDKFGRLSYYEEEL